MAQSGPIAVAIAEFDNQDTSGESVERTADHATRVNSFDSLLREILAGQERFEFVPLACPKTPCSPFTMRPEEFLQAGKDSGARLLVYGGVHKTSTLVMWGAVQVVDIEKDRLVLNRSFSFRGDTDEAFRRAARFIGRYFEELAVE